MVDNAGYSLLGNFEKLPTADIERQCATKFAVEGLSLSVANEVEHFGIKVTVVEPDLFRTDLLDARNVRYGANVIESYATGSWQIIIPEYYSP